MSTKLSFTILTALVIFGCKPLEEAATDTKAVVNASQNKAIGIVPVKANLKMPASLATSQNKGLSFLGRLINQPLMAVIQCDGEKAFKKIQAAESTQLRFDVKGNKLTPGSGGPIAAFAGCKKISVVNFPLLDEFFAVAYTLSKHGDVAKGDKEFVETDRNTFRMAQLIYLSLRGTFYSKTPSRVSPALSKIEEIERFYKKPQEPLKLSPFLKANIQVLDRWFNPCDKSGMGKIDKHEFMKCVYESDKKVAGNYLPAFGKAFKNFDDMVNKFDAHIDRVFQMKNGYVAELIENPKSSLRAKSIEALNATIVNYEAGKHVANNKVNVDQFLAELSGQQGTSIKNSFSSNTESFKGAETVVGHLVEDSEMSSDQPKGAHLRWFPGRGILRAGAAGVRWAGRGVYRTGQWLVNRGRARVGLWRSGRIGGFAPIQRYNALVRGGQSYTGGQQYASAPSYGTVCQNGMCCRGGSCFACSSCQGGSCPNCGIG